MYEVISVIYTYIGRYAFRHLTVSRQANLRDVMRGITIAHTKKKHDKFFLLLVHVYFTIRAHAMEPLM